LRAWGMDLIQAQILTEIMVEPLKLVLMASPHKVFDPLGTFMTSRRTLYH